MSSILRNTRSVIFVVGLTALLIFSIGSTGHTKTINLTVAAGQPPVLLGIKLLRDYFIPEVDRRIAAAGLDVKIKWTQAYAGSLCKATKCIFAVQDRIVDIGFVPTVFHPDKLPLESVGFVAPFVSDQVKVVTDVMDDLHKTIPEMGKQYQKYNQIRLAGGGIDTYHILSTFPIHKMEDVKGVKISAPGAALAWMRGTGAVPVQGNLQLWYNGAKTGIYKAFIIFPSTFLPFKFTEVAPNVSKFNFGAQYAQAATMNMDSFAKLPIAVQKIFKEVAPIYRQKNDGGYQAFSAKSMMLVAKKPSVKIIDISDNERRKWAMAMPNLAKEWAQSMEKKGLPGNKILSSYMNGVRKAGAKPIRNWDKE